MKCFGHFARNKSNLNIPRAEVIHSVCFLRNGGHNKGLFRHTTNHEIGGTGLACPCPSLTIKRGLVSQAALQLQRHKWSTPIRGIECKMRTLSSLTNRRPLFLSGAMMRSRHDQNRMLTEHGKDETDFMIAGFANRSGSETHYLSYRNPSAFLHVEFDGRLALGIS